MLEVKDAYGTTPVGSQADPEDIAPAPKPSGRDHRLDVVRGIAQWFIFLDHIPDNFTNWFTIAKYGFSDAAEIFVYVSGYSAVLAYRKIMEQQGWLFAAARVLKRAWQLYVAHITLFVLFAAQILIHSERVDDPDIAGGMGLDPISDDTARAFLEASLLRYQPTNLDILPIYILFLLAFPILLPLIRKRPLAVLAMSAALYTATRYFGWNLTAYPEGRHWFFDPFAWQFIFILGACFASLGDMRGRLRPLDRLLLPLAFAYLVFALPFALSAQFEWLQNYIPDELFALVAPVKKTTADPLRVLHLLALAYLVMRLVPPDAAFLRWRILDPLRICGKHSLKVFTVGIFLAFTVRSLGEYTEDSNLAEFAVSVAGLTLLCGLAYVAEWFRNRERGAVRKTSSPPAAPAD